MLKEFKTFISRGSVVDLSVGVIIGGAFTTIVNAFVEGLITPLIGLVISLIFPSSKSVDDMTSGLVFSVNGVVFNYGEMISAIVTFLITAAVLFALIKFINKANTLVTQTKEEDDVEEVEDDKVELLLKEIRDLLQEQATPEKPVKKIKRRRRKKSPKQEEINN